MTIVSTPEEIARAWQMFDEEQRREDRRFTMSLRWLHAMEERIRQKHEVLQDSVYALRPTDADGNVLPREITIEQEVA